jgi:hypothetical protein
MKDLFSYIVKYLPFWSETLLWFLLFSFVYSVILFVSFYLKKDYKRWIKFFTIIIYFFGLFVSVLLAITIMPHGHLQISYLSLTFLKECGHYCLPYIDHFVCTPWTLYYDGSTIIMYRFLSKMCTAWLLHTTIALPFYLFVKYQTTRAERDIILKFFIGLSLFFLLLFSLWTLKNYIYVLGPADVWCLNVSLQFFMKFFYHTIAIFLLPKKYNPKSEFFYFYYGWKRPYGKLLMAHSTLYYIFGLNILFFYFLVLILIVFCFFCYYIYKKKPYIFDQGEELTNFYFSLLLILYGLTISLFLFNILLCLFFGPVAFPQFILEIIYAIFLKK